MLNVELNSKFIMQDSKLTFGPDDKVSIAIDRRDLFGMNHRRRVELLDDRGPGDLVSRLEPVAPVDPAVEQAVLRAEKNLSLSRQRGLDFCSLRLGPGDLRLGHEPARDQARATSGRNRA